MLLWLLEGPSKVPVFASHQCGVAGLVMYENNLLVVKEKNKLVGWKLPGGYVNVGEELHTAAIREVWEETGIQTKHQSVLGFRHSHYGQFGRSDLYFFCLLEPLSYDIRVDDEIADAKWMDRDEFIRQNKNEMLNDVMHLVTQSQNTGHGTASLGLNERLVNSVIPGRKQSLFYTAPLTL